MIKVINNFLSKEEYNLLIESNQNGLDIPKHDLSYHRKCISKFIKLPKLKSNITEIISETNKELEADKEFEFIKYLPGDQFYWHDDVQIGNPKVYYVSCIVLLNEDFEGGELLFRENLKIIQPSISTGSLIIFSSKLKHKVNKITKGSRYSLCTWYFLDTSKIKDVL